MAEATPIIHGPQPLRSGDGMLYHRINLLYRIGQDRREFPTERAPPTGNEAVLWIEAAEGIIAFATFYEARRAQLWLDLIWVDPHHRRKGLAKALLMQILAIGQRAGMHTAEFGTMLDNVGMQATGKLLGFEQRYVVMGRKL